MNFLPDEFNEYCDKHAIDKTIYTNHDLTRHVFLCNTEVTLSADFFTSIYSNSRIYRLKGSIRDSYVKHLIDSGDILPMDLWSILAVELLVIKKECHFLDLCCAPGPKMIVAGKFGANTVTGVDISSPRLSIAKSLLKKYKINRVRLFLEDGRFFTKPPEIPLGHISDFSRMKNRPFFSSSDYRKQPCKLLDGHLYDRVLVDAPCTHDGSIKHILKQVDRKWISFNWLYFKNINSLNELQLALLLNGWNLLRPGGILIYSTCSFSYQQNEGIVENFLTIANNAQPYEFRIEELCVKSKNGMCQLLPCELNTSGFFISRFIKSKE